MPVQVRPRALLQINDLAKFTLLSAPGLQPIYKYGGRTLEALSKSSQKVAELDQLENITHHAGAMAGAKRRGRKPIGD